MQLPSSAELFQLNRGENVTGGKETKAEHTRQRKRQALHNSTGPLDSTVHNAGWHPEVNGMCQDARRIGRSGEGAGGQEA